MTSHMFARQPNIVFSGNRRGSLSTCGCFSNQQGGLHYEKALYDLKESCLVKLDAGGWMGEDFLDYESVKARFLLKGLRYFDYDGINFGLSETSLGATYMAQLKQDAVLSETPLLSCNTFSASQPTRLAFADARLIHRRLDDQGRECVTGLIGVTITTSSLSRVTDGTEPPQRLGDYLIRPMIPSLRPVVERLRPQADLLVVLVYGEPRDCQSLACALPQVDLFVAALPLEAKNAAPLPPELARRIVAVSKSKGREIGRVRFAPGQDGRWRPAGPAEFLPVVNTVAPDPQMLKLIEEYKQLTRQFEQLPPANVQMVYAGAITCQKCHGAAHASWQASNHAKALQTLSDRNQQFNPECLPCHTVGFRKDNGFYSVSQSASMLMGDVQCESCHGPSRKHAQTMDRLMRSPLKTLNPAAYQAQYQQAAKALPPKAVPAAVCQGCHSPDHDNKFDYESKKRLIIH